MGYMDEYYKVLENLKSSPKPAGEFPSGSGGMKAPSSFDAYRKKHKKMKFQIGDIAPVLAQKTEEEKRTWFQKGSFEDGYQFGDVSKALLGTLGDTIGNFGAGILGMGESILDTSVLLGPAMEEARRAQSGDPTYVFDAERYKQDQERAKQFIQQDLYDEQQVAKTIISAPLKNILGVDTEADSVFGEKVDAQAQSAGRWVAQRALQTVGMPWWMTMSATSLGSEAEGAFHEGASFDESLTSAGISAAGELISETLFGGMFGETGLDDIIVKDFSRIVSNKVASNLLKIGMKAGGEGFEEAVSWAISNVGKKLTYADEKTWEEIFTSERAIDELVESIIGGALLGSIGSTYEAANMNKAGIDYASGLTENEQKVVDAEYQRRVAEAEKNGKVKESQKAKIYDQVIREMDKGEISTDTIEEILGGETYKTYKEAADKQDALKKELDDLRQMKKGEMNDIQQDRLAELKGMKLDDTTDRDSLKAMLGKEVAELVKSDRLFESYNERTRRGQTFQADLSRYDEKQQKIVQKAIDSGVVNNTRRSHDFVDLVARICADKGIDFDFANNQKIKESGFAVEGAHVNGYVNEKGVTINMQSAKALNTVVGHEVTHVLEGTELYDVLQKSVFDYAQSKGELESGWKSIKNLYKDADNTKVNQELTADLVGDYLFTDADFINSLYSGDRNIFEKVYDEVKYLCKVVTSGSKEARQLEKVKKAFADAYRVDTKNTSEDGGVRYKLSDLEIDRVNVDFKDRNTETSMTDAKVADLISRGKSVHLPSESIAKFEQAVDWTDKKAVRQFLRGVLAPSFGLSVEFKHNGQGAIAYLTSKGVDHSVGGPASPTKAAAFEQFLKLVENAEYIYSSENDTHNASNKKIDGNIVWDTFVAVGMIDGKPYPVTFKIRSIDQDVRSQIYEMATKNETGFSREDGDQNNLTYAHSSYGTSPVSNKSVPQNAQKSSETEVQLVSDNDIAPVREIKPSLSDDIGPVRKYGNYNVMSEEVYYDPSVVSETFDDIAPVNKAAKKAPKTQKREDIAPLPVKQKKQGVMSKLVNRLVDKGMVFENTALKSGNMELQAKWDYALPSKAEARAQYFMRNGKNGAPSLNSVRKKVEKSGKTDAFQEYMWHWRNVDSMTLSERFGIDDKPVFGTSITADISRKKIAQFEKQNPEFKEYAKDLYAYVAEERRIQVESGLITEEQAKHMTEMYPHYIPLHRVADETLGPVQSKNLGVNSPIKSATGGNRELQPMFDTIAQRTLQTFKAVARNDFGVELKNTIQTGSRADDTSADEILDSIDNQSNLLGVGSDGSGYTFSVYENGQKVTFGITEAMYDALKPTDGLLASRIKPLTAVSNFRRNLITSWNPVFALYRNPVKDLQDVMINSQHPMKTYKSVPKAIKELLTGGEFATEYLENGGEQNTYYDNRKSEFTKEDSTIKKLVGLPVRGLENAGEFIERIPRLAEYIASREEGRSIQRSMLDAARVTTNFAAGGDFTKFLNSHGFTFLNAGVQGASQPVRNFREAKMNGLKGWVQLAAKFTVAGLSAELLNGLLFDEEDDEDYEALSDYVKQNYYVVAKTQDGKFVRIPKGRMAAVIQDGMEQMEHLITGDDEADFESFFKLVMDNLAPGNPLDNNIIAPVLQVMNNETWYGDELVPSRLADLPDAEQFDESTDSLSKWLGEELDISPYKINYLIDQYSGGVGDVVLPMLTPGAESNSNSTWGNLVAPWMKEWTTDNVLKNKYPSEFYGLLDELEAASNGKNATDEDKLKSLYMSSVGWEMSGLYEEKRDIQNSDLPDDEKYEAVKEVQKEINALAEEALRKYDKIKIDGNYATIGDRRFDYSEYNEQWYEIEGEYLVKEQDAIERYGITPSEYWNDPDLYYHADGYFDGQYADPNWETVAKLVFGGKKFAPYAAKLSQIKADKDKYGNSISGSKKAKVFSYIDSLAISDVEKAIMRKMNYPSEDKYNYDIVDYLNNRRDISDYEMKTVLEALGMKVDDRGYISW